MLEEPLRGGRGHIPCGEDGVGGDEPSEAPLGEANDEPQGHGRAQKRLGHIGRGGREEQEVRHGLLGRGEGVPLVVDERLQKRQLVADCPEDDRTGRHHGRLPAPCGLEQREAGVGDPKDPEGKDSARLREGQRHKDDGEEHRQGAEPCAAPREKPGVRPGRPVRRRLGTRQVVDEGHGHGNRGGKQGHGEHHGIPRATHDARDREGREHDRHQAPHGQEPRATPIEPLEKDQGGEGQHQAAHEEDRPVRGRHHVGAYKLHGKGRHHMPGGRVERRRPLQDSPLPRRPVDALGHRRQVTRGSHGMDEVDVVDAVIALNEVVGAGHGGKEHAPGHDEAAGAVQRGDDPRSQVAALWTAKGWPGVLQPPCAPRGQKHAEQGSRHEDHGHRVSRNREQAVDGTQGRQQPVGSQRCQQQGLEPAAEQGRQRQEAQAVDHHRLDEANLEHADHAPLRRPFEPGPLPRRRRRRPRRDRAPGSSRRPAPWPQAWAQWHRGPCCRRRAPA